jgi:6-phosphogluconolactonase (cycloisomerase 2 family)
LACQFDPVSGKLNPFQICSALSDRYIGNSRASEISIHPRGHTVYASNRGEDTIAVMSIDQISGRLCLVQSMASGGRTPRHFTLSPDGQWLFVLNEDSDSIVTMDVDGASGLINGITHSVVCGSPVCMVFRPCRN